MRQGNERRTKGSIYNNNGYWWVCVRLPGEKRHKCRPLKAPGSEKTMKADRPRHLAVEAAHRMWENAVRRERRAEAPTATVGDLCDAFIIHADIYYRHSGEAAACACACRFLRECHGELPLAEFRHTDLATVHEAMIRADLARQTVNRYRRTISNRLAPWAFDEGYITAATKAEFAQLMPLKRGRCEARETEPIRPVSEEQIEATIAVMTPNSADMVRVHRLTGMRPGEMCALRWSAIDTTQTPWVYRPEHHKNEWRGMWRVILIGHKARAILEKHREREHPFSPVASVAERMAELRRKRTSPFYPCRDENYSRKSPDAIRVPRDEWHTQEYTRTIHYACRRAGVPLWGANRLRHAFATEVRRKFGLAACQAVLGHSFGRTVTDRYSADALEDETIAAAKEAVETLG